MRRRYLPWLVVAVLVLAACQASESTSPAPSAPGTSASQLPIPSFVGAADLEATIPTDASGIHLTTFSMSGPDFVAGEPNEQFLDFIEGLGADMQGVSVAFGFGSNADGNQTASVFAFQVAGASAPDLTDEFKASAEAGGDPLIWETQTIADKPVEVSEPNDDFRTPVVLYAVGDVLYFVSCTDPAALVELVRQLP